MYQNDPMKVLTGEVRLSYAHLTQPYANPKQPGAKPFRTGLSAVISENYGCSATIILLAL